MNFKSENNNLFKCLNEKMTCCLKLFPKNIAKKHRYEILEYFHLKSRFIKYDKNENMNLFGDKKRIYIICEGGLYINNNGSDIISSFGKADERFVFDSSVLFSTFETEYHMKNLSCTAMSEVLLVEISFDDFKILINKFLKTEMAFNHFYQKLIDKNKKYFDIKMAS